MPNRLASTRDVIPEKHLFAEKSCSAEPVRFEYDRQGEVIEMRDANNTLHEYDRDDVGRVTLDAVTVATGIDGIAIDDRVRAIGTTHDLLGRVERVTSYADTAATTALNEVEFAYDGLWQVTSVTQQHDGPVDINSPAVGIAHDIQPVASGNRSRRTVLTYPDGWELETTYGSSGSVDDLISRTRDLRDAATDAVYAQYDWIGIGTPAIVGYGIPQVSLSRFVAHNGTTTTGQYPGLDRYGRIARQHWSTAAFGPHATNTAVPNRPPIVETAYLYDNASSRTGAFDARPGSAQPLSQSYSYDGLHRLTEATRGIWNGSLTTPSVSQLRDSQAWSLDPLGNWSSVATAATNAGIDDPDDIEIRDYRDAPGGDPENRVNQLMSRTLSASAGGDEPALTYDFAGNILRQELTNDGTDTTALRYTHDAWNRLVKVQFEDDEEDLHPRGEYEYNGLNWRTVARIDTDTTDTTHALDEERFLYYSPEWQVLEARVDSDRQSSPGIDRHIQHVWGVRYIDDIVSTRQDYDPSEENGAELITFHVTDAQFSTVAIVDADATVIERITYTAYGVARHHWRADIDGDGAVGGADLGLVFSAWGTSIGDAGYLAEADLNLDGTIGGADSGLVLAGYQSALAPGVLSSPLVDNRIGYCGYVFAPETQSYLVRFRWYLPPLGRWGQRDPLGYVDGMSLYQYARSSPVIYIDPSGLSLVSADEGCEWCGPDVGPWLVQQMQANRNHPVIKNLREIRWPRYVPFFNLGWTAGFLYDFRNLVKAGGPWDFKVTESFVRGNCPTDKCAGTVTICGICFYKDVPGNIHYGYVARMASLRRWVIYAGGHSAAPGFVDDADDRAAISIGIEMAEKGTPLCVLISAKEAQLNKIATEGCTPCKTRY